MHTKFNFTHGKLVMFHRMWLDGVGIKVIAVKMGISNSFVSHLSKVYGLPSRHLRGINPRDRMYEVFIDPPRGAVYGFPRPYTGIRGGNVVKWMVERGYPRELIIEGEDHNPLYVKWFLQLTPIFKNRNQITSVLNAFRGKAVNREWAYGQLVALCPDHRRVVTLLDDTEQLWKRDET